jgi:hypothetical protein
VAEPHWSPAQAWPLSTQQTLLWQTPAPHAPHDTVCPQLFVLVVLHAVPQVAERLAGSQHAPATQTALAELQLAVPATPHSTVCPQLFFTEPQTAPAHAVATDSGTQPHDPLAQVRPPSHPPQFTI